MAPAPAVARTEVPEAFDEVADRYDLMVALNPGYHAHLRSSASVLVCAMLASSLTSPLVSSSLDGSARRLRVMDLGCGSGASTHALAKALEAADVDYELVGVDASRGMLRQAEGKRWPSQVRFVQARGEELAGHATLSGDEGWDGVFAAYLVRNVVERDSLLATLRSVLRPGGVLVLHEYSVAGNRRATLVWTAVCRAVVVPLGWLTSRRTRLYSYLCRSVLDFDSTATVMDRLVRAGFEDVRSRSVRGWQRGIVHTFHARRPR
jgi:ubiquinone/menaquinone biosynthesis C-methylase UbiE